MIHSNKRGLPQRRLDQAWVERRAGLTAQEGQFINDNPTRPCSCLVRGLIIDLMNDFTDAGLVALRAALVQVRKEMKT